MRYATALLLGILTSTALAAGPNRDVLLDLWARTWRADSNEPVVYVPAWGRIVSSLTSDHGSPWEYDTHTPLILWGPGVKHGRYTGLVRSVDHMATLSRLLGRADDPRLPGRVLTEALQPGPKPKAILTVVLDQCGHAGMVRDLTALPTLSRLVAHGAWFENSHVDYLPTITALYHCVLGTGQYPVVNGITTDKRFDLAKNTYWNAVHDGDPKPIRVPTLMESWHREQGYRPRILAISPAARATVELAGHNTGEPADARKVAVWWDTKAERWATNETFYRMPPVIKDLTLEKVFGTLPRSWLGHPLDTPEARSQSPLMSSLVAETMVRLANSEKIGGTGGPTDLMHITFKDTDTAGHHHGNGSPEFRDALRAADRALGRVIAALERQTGPDGLIVLVTADHGGLPEALRQAGARVTEDEMEAYLRRALPVKTGGKPWLRDVVNPQIYLLPGGLESNGYTPSDVVRALERHPAIAAAFTGAEIMARQRRTP